MPSIQLLLLLSLSTLLPIPFPAPALINPSKAARAEDPGPGTLPTEEIRTRLAAEDAHKPFVPEAPLGLGDLSEVIPEDNPMTPAKVELGRQLYFDPRLSKDETISCATCHHPNHAWADGAPVSTGIDGQKGGRSAPTVINRLVGKTQFWDGRAASLEEQALGPIANPIEMGFSPEAAAQRLNGIPGYVLQFEAVFGPAPQEASAPAEPVQGVVTPDRIAKAIAAFERTVISGASKNDYFEKAMPYFDTDPEDIDDPELRAKVEEALELELQNRMSESAERGRELFFGKAQCSACHAGRDFSDELFHNIGVGIEAEEPDMGRFVVTGEESDKGAFRTPTVRNIALTAPYMHDGSQKTLMEVVEHYDKGGTPNPWLSDKIGPLKLSDQDKTDLVAFMEEALSGSLPEIDPPRLP